MFRAVLFDLDGTLLDTLPDIRDGMNRALLAFGLPQYDREAYRNMVGWGVERLAELAVPAEDRDRIDFEELVQALKREYAAQPVTGTTAFPGMAELAAELKKAGVPTAVLSNKPHEITTNIVTEVLGAEVFTAVYGARAEFPKKPDPQAALRIAQDMGVPPQEMVFVGDTAIDMETAQAAGMYPVGVSWGYREVEELWMHGAAMVTDDPAEIRSLVLHEEDSTTDEEIPVSGR